jgi:hypothetical protein
MAEVSIFFNNLKRKKITIMESTMEMWKILTTKYNLRVKPKHL